MSATQTYMFYRGYALPTETHSEESLKFAQEFEFGDDDVVAVTYPKSGVRTLPDSVDRRLQMCAFLVSIVYLSRMYFRLTVFLCQHLHLVTHFSSSFFFSYPSSAVRYR